MPKQTLALHSATFCIHSLDHDSPIPDDVLQSPIFFISKTEDELSVVVPDDVKVQSEASDANWRALEVLGPLSLSMVGIMAPTRNEEAVTADPAAHALGCARGRPRSPHQFEQAGLHGLGFAH